MNDDQTSGSSDKPGKKKQRRRSMVDRVVKAVSAGIAGAAIEETAKEAFRQVERVIRRTDGPALSPEDDAATEINEADLLAFEEGSEVVEATVIPAENESTYGEVGFGADVPDTFFVACIVPEQSGLNDLEDADAEWVEASPSDFLEFGELLPYFLVDSSGFATSEEMAEASLLPVLNIQFMQAESYHIVPGDTLSEIALAHGTSVETLMGLNPHIEDPNLIYAGTDLIVPQHSESQDVPAEVLEVELTDHSDFQQSEIDVEEHSDGDFEPIEWEQFEPHESADYQDALDQMDFNDFEPPASYIDDGFGEVDWGDFDASLGFR